MPESCSARRPESSRGGRRRAAQVLRLHRPLCHVLGVAHDDVPTKKRAYYGLLHGHREAMTCRQNRIERITVIQKG